MLYIIMSTINYVVHMEISMDEAQEDELLICCQVTVLYTRVRELLL